MDILIKNAKVVDGTGVPAYAADIAVTGGRISQIGQITETCGQVIDAAGRVVMPGIIDPHSHADVGIFDPEWSHQRIVQGITTELTGHCGPSPAPNCPEHMDLLRRIYFELTGAGRPFDWPFQDFDGWLKAVEKQKLSANYGFLVGHSTLRVCVMGEKTSKATTGEIRAMQELLDRALNQGAMGLSFGLSYFPGAYADTEELTELARVVKKHDGIIASHRRDEGDRDYESIAEMIQIARETGVRMNLSHVKVTGSANWGKGSGILRLIQEGFDEGLDLSIDAYPYTAGYTQLFKIFPIEVWGNGMESMYVRFSDPAFRQRLIEDTLTGRSGMMATAKGGAAGIQVIQCADAAYDMKTLAQISEEMGQNPVECAIRIIEQCGDGVQMFCFLQDEGELDQIMLYPHTRVISDGAPAGGHKHPRYMGTFSLFLERFVKQQKKLTLEEAVKRMTVMPAQRYRLRDRGMLREGGRADLVVLDWENFQCNCSYEAPMGPSKGISYVLLNGKIAAKDGVYTGEGQGEVLRF